MFGKVANLEHQLMVKEWEIVSNKERIRKLEVSVVELTKALEWHVGTSLKVMNLEEKLIMCRIDEQKKRGERFGDEGEAVAQQTCDDINKSVEEAVQNARTTEVE